MMIASDHRHAEKQIAMTKETKPTCTWERVHSAMGFFHYRSDCGHDISDKHEVTEANKPATCWGCGKPIKIEC